MNYVTSCLSKRVKRVKGVRYQYKSSQLPPPPLYLTAPPLFCRRRKKFCHFFIKKTFFFLLIIGKKEGGLTAPPPYFFKILVGRGGAVDSIYTDIWIFSKIWILRFLDNFWPKSRFILFCTLFTLFLLGVQKYCV